MKISIIMPIYNAEKYLENCLISIKCQTFKDFELILVNDGSKDRSAEICEEYRNQFNHVNIVHKENGGSASARNVGLNLCTGDYIAFVDADDYITATYLESLYELAIRYSSDLVECSFLTVSEQTHIIKERKSRVKIQCLSNIEMLEALCNKQTYLKTVVLWNKLFKRELWDNLRFLEGKGVDDELVIHEILYKSKISVVTDEVLYYYYLSEGSQMRSKYSLKSLDSIEAIEMQLIFLQQHKLEHIYNMLLYRYFSSILFNRYMLKKFFKEEKQLINQLNKKRNLVTTVFRVKEVSVKDKLILLAKFLLPSLIFLRGK